jgi:hypothetical protein
MLAATVSGSFHRHMEAISAAVHELVALSVSVLSPADPRIVLEDQGFLLVSSDLDPNTRQTKDGEFLYVASDIIRSVRLVQDRHLECIRMADFLWLVCPDGYIGQSASMEIGYAAASGVPVYSIHAPTDLTLRQYVKIVPSIQAAIDISQYQPARRREEGILVDPRASIAEAHALLERIEKALTRRVEAIDPAHQVRRDFASLQAKLVLPTYTH